MEDITFKSPELEAFMQINKRKVDHISEKNLLEKITNLPADGITADGLDWEIGKKSISISIKIDRGNAVEFLTWELKVKK